MFSFGIKDIIDILIVALLLYTLYKMMKESGTISIFTGVLAFVGVWIVVTQILDMRLIGSIMDKFMSVGLLILVILFQDEIKRFLVQLGSHKRWRFFFNFFLKHKETGEKPYIMPIVQNTQLDGAKTSVGIRYNRSNRCPCRRRIGRNGKYLFGSQWKNNDQNLREGPRTYAGTRIY